jgi:hypothetical protein
VTHYSPVSLALLIALLSVPLRAGESPQTEIGFHAVRCEGAYPSHLQGVDTDRRRCFFWSFTDILVKTDPDGRVLKRVDVASHHGDLCYRDGKVYVAVNLGEFNKPAGHADSRVFVYDPETLDEIARHAVPEVVHGAGGIAFGDGRFLVVGGLPPDVKENYLYEYDPSFAFRKRHALQSGYTLLGIQTAAFDDGAWWLGCYGTPQQLLKADKELALAGRWSFNASLGIISLGHDRYLVARNTRQPDQGYVGELRPAVADETNGLRLAD